MLNRQQKILKNFVNHLINVCCLKLICCHVVLTTSPNRTTREHVNLPVLSWFPALRACIDPTPVFTDVCWWVHLLYIAVFHCSNVSICRNLYRPLWRYLFYLVCFKCMADSATRANFIYHILYVGESNNLFPVTDFLNNWWFVLWYLENSYLDIY